MKPLPAQKSPGAMPKGEPLPTLTTALPSSSGRYSTANRRTGSCAVQRAYPWLLSASTLIAAAFCLLYITKPIIAPASISNGSAPTRPEVIAPVGVNASLLPGKDRLPGETAALKPTPANPRRDLPGQPSPTAFEETNLRIQHILTAEAPGGHVDRIDIDVPVLYQSRNLRWTTADVATARELLNKLMDHQEKTRQLRAEGVELLDAWNALVSGSLPADELRADSPSLPDNQEDAANSPRPAGWTTTESIQIQAPSGK
jgi:hypothetical protein